MDNRDIVQDVVPPQRKSIRDIPLPNNKKQYNGTANGSVMPPRQDVGGSDMQTPPVTSPGETPPVPPIMRTDNNNGMPPRRKNRKNKYYIFGLGAALILILFIAVMSFFDAAKLTVTPRQETMAVNQTFTAVREDDSSGVPYQTIRISGENGKVVPATEGEFVETKASGTILVENNYSEASQKLIANTRFESKSGLIYRIKDAITVPGMKGNAPGTVEVTVFADEAGPEYNTPNNTFTIPGLEGDPRFDGFGAKTVSAINGGFSGTAKKVSTDVKTKAQQEIQGELKAKLIAEAESTIPSDFIFIPGATTFNFEEMPQTDVQETAVQINERLILEGVIFNKQVLNDAILGIIFPDARGKATITTLANLDFTVPETIEETFDFTVSGEANIVWDIDTDDLQQSLAGTKRKNLNGTLVNYPAIERAEAVLRPFWKRSFPRNPNEIDIIIEK